MCMRSSLGGGEGDLTKQTRAKVVCDLLECHTHMKTSIYIHVSMELLVCLNIHMNVYLIYIYIDR